MSKKILLLLLVIVLLALIIIDTFAFVNYFKNGGTDSLKEATAVDQTDWVIYKNTDVGFQFSYPPRFPKQSNIGSPNEEYNKSNILFGENSEKGLFLRVGQEVNGGSLDQYFRASLALVVPEEAKQQFKKETIEIGGIPGYRVQLQNVTTQVVFLVNSRFISLSAPVTNNRDILSEEEMNGIINSFKFEKE